MTLQHSSNTQVLMNYITREVVNSDPAMYSSNPSVKGYCFKKKIHVCSQITLEESHFTIQQETSIKKLVVRVNLCGERCCGTSQKYDCRCILQIEVISSDL